MKLDPEILEIAQKIQEQLNHQREHLKSKAFEKQVKYIGPKIRAVDVSIEYWCDKDCIVLGTQYPTENIVYTSIYPNCKAA